jgi:23S rRNA pseudouridine1911/1915/1917 synthase
MSSSEITTDSTDSRELYEHFSVKVDAGQEPLRIDKFLVNRIEKTSRTKIQNAASAGLVSVNGKPVKSNYKIKANDEVKLVLPQPPLKLELIPEDIPLDIVYEDEYLVVLNKQPGMVVHPGHGNYTGTLVNALIYHFNQMPDASQDNTRPGLVHRLDKDTSGLMVVARDEFAMMHLAKQFFDRKITRAYQALVWGDFEEDEGQIEGHIGRHLRNRMCMDVFPEEDFGKYALTYYRVLKRFGYVSLVECRLKTGRTHQIRVHMQHIGHPLFNDDRYGGDAIVKGTVYTKYKQFVNNCFKVMPRQALHAKTLGFIHPNTGKEMMFDSDLPEDFTQLLEKWDTYASFRKD